MAPPCGNNWKHCSGGGSDSLSLSSSEDMEQSLPLKQSLHAAAAAEWIGGTASATDTVVTEADIAPAIATAVGSNNTEVTA